MRNGEGLRVRLGLKFQANKNPGLDPMDHKASLTAAAILNSLCHHLCACMMAANHHELFEGWTEFGLFLYLSCLYQYLTLGKHSSNI